MKQNIDNRQDIGANDVMASAAGEMFEKEFMAHSLDQQITQCDHYELANYFAKLLPNFQPILEAGCGSGRWVAWFVKNGWAASGLDWSEECCERAQCAVPEARIEAGDMRNMPFKDGEFGAIVSLGAIEHTPEGPELSLKEFYRVLRPEGIAIITVPYLGSVRWCQRLFCAPKIALIHNSFLRRQLGKNIGPRTYREAHQEIHPGYAADFTITKRGWEFYQYQFTKKQMRLFLQNANFEIREEFIEFSDEGILHNFGRVAGKYDHEKGMVSLNVIGKGLRSLLPLNLVGHMLCYLVEKKV